MPKSESSTEPVQEAQLLGLKAEPIEPSEPKEKLTFAEMNQRGRCIQRAKGAQDVYDLLIKRNAYALDCAQSVINGYRDQIK